MKAKGWPAARAEDRKKQPTDKSTNRQCLHRNALNDNSQAESRHNAPAAASKFPRPSRRQPSRVGALEAALLNVSVAAYSRKLKTQGARKALHPWIARPSRAT